MNKVSVFHRIIREHLNSFQTGYSSKGPPQAYYCGPYTCIKEVSKKPC